MSAASAIGSGAIAMAAVCGAGFAAWAFIEISEWRRRRSARTPDAKAEIVRRQYVREHRAAGHKNPEQAADDQIAILVLMERFRRYACNVYAVEEKTLDDIKGDWWKAHAAGIKDFARIGRNEIEAAHYVRTAELAIIDATADEIFVYGDAAAKHQKRWREIVNDVTSIARDPVKDNVMEGLFAARRGL